MTAVEKQDMGVLVALGVGIFLFPLLTTSFSAIHHYLDIMVFVGIFSLVNIGLSLLMGYAGQVSLGQAAFFGLGAYVSGVLTTNFGWSPWAALPAGMVLTGLVALAVGVPSLKLKGHYLAMATLGFGVIVFVVFNEEVALTGGPSGLADIPGISLGGWQIDTTVKYYYFVWAIVLAVLLVSLNIIHSRVGRALRSIHGSEKAANAMGVPTSLYKTRIFVLSAVYASLAGSLYTHYMTFLSPGSFDLFWSIKFLMMVVIGGMGSIWGAMLGTCLLSYLSNEWLHMFQDFDVLVYGLILLVVIMFLPKGLVSVFRKG
ncbi:MAG: branched-chain amino acid ABC transporter permease [Thermodesulfobacteriota bacterium]|nr:branched-chain amino acid ABC transporter permease [Thermodesulfobacteriota bacterium]